MITGFDHVHFMCGDVEEAGRYFVDILGGSEVSRGAIKGWPTMWLDVSGVSVILMGCDPKNPPLEIGKGKRGLDHFSLKVSDIENTVAELTEKGAHFSTKIAATATGDKFIFMDGPDGIRIELIER